MGTITFEFIRKIQMKEQKSSQLSEIPEDFYESVANYLRKKKETTNEKKNLLEIKNIERLVKNIFERRERKLLNAALLKVRTGIEPKNITSKEKEFFDKVVELLKERRKKILEPIFSPGKKEKVSLVVFKDDFPEFVGVDGETYGPFKKGDIAKIPEENIKILIEEGVVEEFKIEK